MKIITVNVPDSYLKMIDTLVGEQGLYPSRSELMRVAVREFLIKEMAEAGKFNPTYMVAPPSPNTYPEPNAYIAKNGKIVQEKPVPPPREQYIVKFNAGHSNEIKTVRVKDPSTIIAEAKDLPPQTRQEKMVQEIFEQYLPKPKPLDFDTDALLQKYIEQTGNKPEPLPKHEMHYYTEGDKW